MRCKVCGREAMNPEANFCDYCGSSFREYGKTREEAAVLEQGKEGYSAFGMSSESIAQTVKTERELPGTGQEKPVTMWTYLGTMLLVFVPYVGFYAFLGILLYWSFAAGGSPTRKTFARAMLIFSGVLIVVAVFGIAAMMESGMFDSILDQMGALHLAYRFAG